MSTVYPVTPEIVEWLNHTLSPMEQSVFHHYRGIQHLVDIVDRAEAGDVPKYAAANCIYDHNKEHKTHITYEEVRSRCSTFIMSGIGEWVVYSEDMPAVNKILAASDDIMEAINETSGRVNWIVLWLTGQDVVVVFDSPFEQKLEILDEEQGLLDGVSRGSIPAPTLPPDIVAGMWQLHREEILTGTRR